MRNYKKIENDRQKHPKTKKTKRNSSKWIESLP
jgi:hypothetical protein